MANPILPLEYLDRVPQVRAALRARGTLDNAPEGAAYVAPSAPVAAPGAAPVPAPVAAPVAAPEPASSNYAGAVLAAKAAFAAHRHMLLTKQHAPARRMSTSLSELYRLKRRCAAVGLAASRDILEEAIRC